MVALLYLLFFCANVSSQKIDGTWPDLFLCLFRDVKWFPFCLLKNIKGKIYLCAAGETQYVPHPVDSHVVLPMLFVTLVGDTRKTRLFVRPLIFGAVHMTILYLYCNISTYMSILTVVLNKCYVNTSVCDVLVCIYFTLGVMLYLDRPGKTPIRLNIQETDVWREDFYYNYHCTTINIEH